MEQKLHTNAETRETLRKNIGADALKFARDHTIIQPDGQEQPENGWLFDFRSILMQSHVADRIATLFWDEFEAQYPFQVGGLETAALPLISAIIFKGETLGYPVNGFFIRKERKQTGLQNVIEGTLNEYPVVLVDDLINSGSSFKKQVKILENEGHSISALFTILRFREMDAYASERTTLPPLTAIFSLRDFGLFLRKKEEKNRPAGQKTGFEALWRFASSHPNLFYIVPKSRPVLDSERIYFGADNKTFWALDQRDGSVAWKFTTWHRSAGKAIFSAPALHDARVYFGAYDGSVYALEKETGKKSWEFKEADWVGSSPVVAPELNSLFIGLEFGLFTKKGGVVALDLETGKKKWGYYEMSGLTHASPGYSKKHTVVVCGCNDHYVYAFDAKTGALRWTYGTSGEIKYGVAFDDARRWTIFGSMDGNMYILDTKTGEHVHTFETNGPIYSTPLLKNDRLYVGSYDKHLYCFDLNTQELLWKFKTLGKILTSPVSFNDRIYIGSNDGFLYEIDTNGVMTDFFTTGERIVNNVVYNPETRRYFLPTFANEIYCLKKMQKGTASNTDQYDN